MKAPHGAAPAFKSTSHGPATAGLSNYEGYEGRPPKAPNPKHIALHKRAKGGGIGEIDENEKAQEYTKESNVMDEAKRRARGGKVHKGKMPHMIKVEGRKGGHRMDRPGRKRGGSVGADSHPMTEAANLTGGGGGSDD